MKSITLLFLFFTSGLLLAQQTQSITISSGGIDRDFFLYVPEIYDDATPAPLVFCFHGYGSSASVNLSYTGFRPVADTAGFILIHPQGTLDITGTAHWNVGWGLSTVDDVAFTQDMIDYTSDLYNVDSERVYSTGMSNGGFMSYVLACELSNEIAAIASVTGSMSPPTASNCNPSHPTPILQIHGTADPTVPYEGAIFSQNIDDVLSYWVNHNNCNTTPSQTPIPDINPGDGSTVDHFVYGSGENGATVELFKVYNGGHDWPGVFGNFDISSNIEIWKFFSKFDINGTLSLPNNNSDFSLAIIPNPSHDNISIEHSFEIGTAFKIMNLNGKEVLAGILSSKTQQLNVSHLNSGVYLFICNGLSKRLVVNN
jgi:polyhydroxybutyrate depolymerase